MKNRILKSILALLALVPSVAAADITMHINEINNEFWFSGSATGSLTDVGAYTQIEWENTDASSTENMALGLSNAFTLGAESISFDMFLYDSDDSIQIVLYSASKQTSGTLTADPSTVYDYTSFFDTLTVDQEAAFESLIGQTIPLTYGSGFSGLHVVPEPSEVASALGLGALAAAMILRRRKTA